VSTLVVKLSSVGEAAARGKSSSQQPAASDQQKLSLEKSGSGWGDGEKLSEIYSTILFSAR